MAIFLVDWKQESQQNTEDPPGTSETTTMMELMDGIPPLLQNCSHALEATEKSLDPFLPLKIFFFHSHQHWYQDIKSSRASRFSLERHLQILKGNSMFGYQCQV
eukprot:TRINITY_DN179_c0_g1_i15.p2 TRINITY_DN179_c0_g1~~TRINITY_DN179_c0_g1_i15.p2  ORF type:complete len:104 (-),score=26.49 TRINITY_DN179_c0_g1_i15:470-781(-)